MMRPRYESETDRANERIVEDALRNLGIEAHKLPVSYRLDWLLTKDGVARGFAELKARRCNMKDYPSVMISLSKVMAADQLTQTTGLPCYLILLYRDALARVEFHEDFTVGMGGRTDRDDPADYEVCAFFPIERLSVISQTSTDVSV